MSFQADTYMSIGGDCTTQHIGFGMGLDDVMAASPILRVRDAGEPLILALVGEADLYHAPALRSRLKAAICDLGRQTIVVDLLACEYMDSSTMNILLAMGRLAWELGKKFVLARPTRHVRRTMELMHMHRVLTIVEDLDLNTLY